MLHSSGNSLMNHLVSLIDYSLCFCARQQLYVQAVGGRGGVTYIKDNNTPILSFPMNTKSCSSIYFLKKPLIHKTSNANHVTNF